MYHIGKVIKVIKAGKETVKIDEGQQALLEMWDENYIMTSIHPQISNKVEVGQFVLVKYVQPEEYIIKALGEKEGNEIWKIMKEYDRKRKNPHTQTEEPELILKRPPQIPRMFG